jgi:hypothetical protein
MIDEFYFAPYVSFITHWLLCRKMRQNCISFLKRWLTAEHKRDVDFYRVKACTCDMVVYNIQDVGKVTWIFLTQYSYSLTIWNVHWLPAALTHCCLSETSARTVSQSCMLSLLPNASLIEIYKSFRLELSRDFCTSLFIMKRRRKLLVILHSYLASVCVLWVYVLSIVCLNGKFCVQ